MKCKPWIRHVQPPKFQCFSSQFALHGLRALDWNFHSRFENFILDWKFQSQTLFFCRQRGAWTEQKNILDWKFHSILKAWFFQDCLSRLDFFNPGALWAAKGICRILRRDRPSESRHLIALEWTSLCAFSVPYTHLLALCVPKTFLHNSVGQVCWTEPSDTWHAANIFRRRTNVQQLTCNIDLSCSFSYFFFSFALIERKPFVLKGKDLGQKFWKRVKKCEKCEKFWN